METGSADVDRPGRNRRFQDEPDCNADGTICRMMSEIRQTEARLAEDIFELQKRLTPDRIIDEFISGIQEEAFRRIEIMNTKTLSEMGEKIGSKAKETMKDHPYSSALVGFGAGYFMYKSMKKKSAEESETTSSETSIPQAPYTETETPPGMEYGLSGGEYHLGPSPTQQSTQEPEISGKIPRFSQYRETAKQYGEKALEKTHAARTRLSEYADENPFVVGFIGLSLGVVVGVLTSKALSENELIDETRRTLKEKTRGLLRETREKAGHIIEEARRAAKEEAERQNLITH